jgi:hypothetical protein
MKSPIKFILTLGILFILSTIVSNKIFAQTTANGIFFQAIARDNFSNPAKDRKIYVQSSIIQSTATGTKVLTEEYQTTTDATGVFSISVGLGARIGGTANNLTGIDWANGPYYLNLKVAITPVAPTTSWNYKNEWIDLGSTPFGVVPYALYAGTANGLDAKLSIKDTTSMLAIYAKAQAVKTLESTVNTKVGATDTAAMLAPYRKMVNEIIASSITSLTADAINAALNSKVNLADSTKVYITPMQLKGVKFDTISIIKKIDTKLNLADSIIAYVTPLQMASKITDTSSISNRINLKADAVELISGLALKLNKSDTSSISNRINLKADDVELTSGLALKLNKSDTSSISNRINLKADAVELISGLALKLNKSDTISFSNRIDLKEISANKSRDNTLGGINANDILFPTQKAVKEYVAANSASGGVADGGITTIKLADQAVTDVKILSISATKINGTLAIANGGTGATTASAARTNLGLGNVDNTTDASKPISTATQTALDLKLNTNGNAATATKLVTPRNINGALFDGSADISIPAKFTSNVTINLSGSKSLGKYANGATIPSAGKTLDEFLLDLVTESIHPSYQAPYVSISSNKSASYEIGTSIGLVTLNSGYGQRNGGAMTSTTYYKNGVSLGAGVNSNIHGNLTTSISYSVTMTYGAGPVLNDNLGNPDPYGQIAAGSTSSSLTISPFAYKYFGASASNTINDAILLLAGTSKEVASSKAKSNFNVPISGGAKYIFYAYPASLGTLTSITVEGFGSFDAFSVFTQDVTNASGHVQSYKIYISNNSFESDVNNIIIN